MSYGCNVEVIAQAVLYGCQRWCFAYRVAILPHWPRCVEAPECFAYRTRVFGTSAYSAAQGSADAQFSLGLMCAVGRGVEVNEGRAYKFLGETVASWGGPVWAKKLVLRFCIACCGNSLHPRVSLLVEFPFWSSCLSFIVHFWFVL